MTHMFTASVLILETHYGNKELALPEPLTLAEIREKCRQATGQVPAMITLSKGVARATLGGIKTLPTFAQ